MNALARRPPALNPPRGALDIIRALAGLAAFSYHRGLAQQVQALEKRTPAFIGIQEAKERSGLSETLIRRLIAAKRLGAIRDGAVKVCTTDLDALNTEDLLAAQKRVKSAAEELRGAVKARRAGV